MTQSKLSISYLEKIIPFIGLILLVIIISALNSAFLEPSNLFNLLRQVS
ncbi:MAG: ribose ABC transporter permease, partial [Staphylococcus equorum]|nr:ribose ABC transporter permease [Staphylococcus equorum]